MGSLLSKAEPGEPVRQLIGIVVVVEMEKSSGISVSAVLAICVRDSVRHMVRICAIYGEDWVTRCAKWALDIS